jgi:hypothetical protein
MEELFHYLDLKALKLIQEKAEAELNDSLLNGSSWQQVKAKRRVVTDVAIEIHKRVSSTYFPSPDPSGKNIRNS